MKYIVCISLISGIYGSSAPAVRRLIIDGSTAEVSDYPFVVALMYCRSSGSGALACASFCSGSLIAPHVVLTAGHCIYDTSDSSFNHDVPPFPLSNMFALIGSSDWSQLASNSGARLVRVTKVINRGYSKNLRYDFDHDVGLAFLAECVPELPSRIEYIRVATRESEISGACTRVTTLGFGKHANVPPEIFVHDGRLRVLHGDTLHSHETCQAAFADARSREAKSYGIDLPSDLLDHEVNPEMHLCAGGDTVASSCHGDSGGPVIGRSESGSIQVVGVTSFGGLTVCMASPDFLTRVSTQAAWIRDQISDLGKSCPGWSPSDSFATWPLPETPAIPNRCKLSEWQCAISEECIPLPSVCDRIPNCADQSDEDTKLCRVAYLSSGPSVFVMMSQERAGNLTAPTLTAYDNSQSAVEAEFDALLAAATPTSTASGVAKSADSNSAGIPVSVSVIGLLHSVDGRARSAGLSLSAGSSPSDIAQKCKSTSFVSGVRQSVALCAGMFQEVRVQIDLERRQGRNTMQRSPLIPACKNVKACIGGSGSFDTWFEELNRCRQDDPMILVPQDWALVDFCGPRLDTLLSVSDSKESYAESFGSTFGHPVCSSEQGLDTMADTSERANGESQRRESQPNGSKSSFIEHIVLCILFLIQTL